MSLTLRFGSPATSWLTQASLLLKLWHSCPVFGELESSHVISIQFTRALSLASQIHWRIHDSSLMFAHASFSMFSLNKIIAHPAAGIPWISHGCSGHTRQLCPNLGAPVKTQIAASMSGTLGSTVYHETILKDIERMMVLG